MNITTLEGCGGPTKPLAKSAKKFHCSGILGDRALKSGCAGLTGTDFLKFPLWIGVVVLKGLNF